MNALAEFAASLTNNVALLLVVMPVIGAVLVRLMSRTGDEPVYFTALTNVWLCCGLVVMAVMQIEPQADFQSLFRPQMLTSLEWPGMSGAVQPGRTPADGVPSGLHTPAGEGSAAIGHFPSPRISVAINGFNLWFVALTVAATAAAVCRVDLKRDRLAARLSWLLLTQSALVGTLVAQDVILLSGFNLASVIGLFFLIGFSTNPDRRSAARRFFRVQLSSALMLAIGLVGAAVGHWWMVLAAEVVIPVSFSLNQIVALIPDLAATTETGRAYWNVVSPWLFLLICGSCLLRIPLPPLHHWFLLTIERSDRGTSGLMACGFLPTGLYLIARVLVPLFPERLPELSERLMTWSLLAAVLMAVAGIQLVNDWCNASSRSASAPLPANNQTARLVGVALVVSLSIAFGSIIVADSLTIRGGLLIAVSAAASAGLAFWMIADEDSPSRASTPLDQFSNSFKWLAVSGLVAMPVSGTFWGLMMSAHGFMRLNSSLTLLLSCTLILFAGSVLRSISRRTSPSERDDTPESASGIAGLLPLSAIFIVSATCPALVCGPPLDDGTAAEVTQGSSKNFRKGIQLEVNTPSADDDGHLTEQLLTARRNTRR